MSQEKVYRVVESTFNDPAWVSRPYATLGAARNQASKKNNEVRDNSNWWAKRYDKKLPFYYVQEGTTTWKTVQ